MITPDEIQEMEDLSSEELRERIGFMAGIHAHRDGDEGATMAMCLRRIAYALDQNRIKSANA